GTTVSQSEINAHGAFGRSGNGTDNRGERRRSITFAPNVQLDSGQELPLQEPLPRRRNRYSTEGGKFHLNIYGSSPPSPAFSFTGIRRGSGFDLYGGSEDGEDSQSSRGGYGSSLGSPRGDDLDIASDEKDRMGSLTSASTA